MFGLFKTTDDSANDLGGDFIAYANASAALTVQPKAAAGPASSPAIGKSGVVATATTSASVLSDMIAHETNGSLSFAGALAVLRDAAAQPMTSALYVSLQVAAKALNVAGGVATGGYVQQIFDDVVLGNSANKNWNGGSTTPTPLGNLSATSSATQFNKLIGKWFLGTDLPGDASAPGASPSGIAYQTYALPLFASAGPQITDVNQGQLGDCWFLAAVAETALLNPSLIKNMIVAHANGAYSVEFWVNGKADFVTVNAALPSYTNGSMQWDGSRMVDANSTTSLWVPLVEKALAQLAEQSGVVTGMQFAGGQNQYYELNAGAGEGVSLITGQSSAAYSIGGQSPGGLATLLGQMNALFSTGHDVLMGTSGQAVSGDLVASHMFAVTGVDVANGLVSLYNPWGANGVGAGKPESFTIAASALAADNAWFYAGLGVSKAA